MASGRIRGITIEIGGDTTKLVSSLKKVDTQIRNTQNALKDVNKLLKLDPGNTELLRQKQQLLKDAVAQTADRLQQLKDAQSGVAKGTAEWDALQREIIETQQNLDGLEKDMKDFGSVTAQQVKVVGQKFQEVGGKIESAGRAMSKVSGAAAAALGGIAKLGYDAVTAADDLNTLAKQTGVSTDELQKWSYAADLVDVSTESITGAMKKMKKNLDSNSDAFEALGVKTKDANGNFRDSTEIFYDTIAALSKIDNETERDIAAMEIFGKGADELAGIIDDGGAALKAYGEEAEQMGLIIGGDTLNKLNEANDTIDKMKATWGASLAQAGATIATAFAPVLEKLVGLLAQVAEKVRNLTPAQVEMITKILAVVAVVGPLLVILGKLVSVIGFVMANIEAIGAVMAVLTGPVGLVIAAIAALTAAFVYFYNTSEEFRNTVNSVINAIMPVLQKIFEFIKAQFLQMVDNIRSHIETIKAIIHAFIVAMEYLKTQVSNAVSNVKNLFTNMKNGIYNIFTDLVNKFRTWGKDMIENFIGGIKEKWDTLKNTLSETADSIKKYLGFSEPEMGPLSNFHTFAPDMMKLFAQGITDNANLITDAVKQSFNIQPIIEAQQIVTKNQPMAAPMAANNSPIAVNVTLQGDAKYLYKVVNAEAIRNHQITGIAFGS